MSWNVGGLSEVLFEELKKWLNLEEQREVCVLILQETHWDFSSDWSGSGWYFCHSSTGKRGSGGILIGVRSTVADAQSIRWQEPEPGRILHVCCFLGVQQMDIIGVYQHAYLMKAGMTDRILAQRSALLRKLDSLLSSLPVRSHILKGGDYNAALISESRVCGHGILQKELSDKEKDDQSKLMNILKRHRLEVGKEDSCLHIHSCQRNLADRLRDD